MDTDILTARGMTDRRCVQRMEIQTCTLAHSCVVD